MLLIKRYEFSWEEIVTQNKKVHNTYSYFIKSTLVIDSIC